MLLTRASTKQLLARLHDVIMAGLAMTIALLARYDLQSLPPMSRLAWWVLSFAAIAGVMFALFGLGRGIWRFASLSDLRSIVLSSTAAIFAFLILHFLVDRLAGFPRATPLILWFVLIVLLGAPRIMYRAYKDGHLGGVGFRKRDIQNREHVLIVGHVGDADNVIRNYKLESSRLYKVEGIVELGAGKRSGRAVRGVPVIGSADELERIVGRLAMGGVPVSALLLATPRAGEAGMQSLAASAARLKLPLRRVVNRPLTGTEPDLASITLEDLLGRPPVQLQLEAIRSLIGGQTVLVTGAGGSIGSEIVRQVVACNPASIILFDSSEYALYEIDLEVSRLNPDLPRQAVIGNVRDRRRVHEVMQACRPAVVFHAAALKHVPLVENNICEGVLTNVLGTRNVADAAVACGARAMVQISTDKAVRPTSMMGRTKRIAEAYCQALDISGVDTRFITVRFGNVLGSNGSVVPLFKRQIAAGGPITVTHPEMTRYFMTIREATELVLQAASAEIGREETRGRIFVLDMGEPVKILTLARTMISLAGLRPDEDIAIKFTGLRPGEKLYEELFDANEMTTPHDAEGFFVASAGIIPLERLTWHLERLGNSAAAGGEDQCKAMLIAALGEVEAGSPVQTAMPRMR
ncbi:polysaccharide biosynthesis protein [Pannonibacter phragmitetus]|uniref:polysaccharide biosynthesis protein n=1 Tax=Pannonibacter phragmitetus TaxID=121719 RepID=UPI001AD9349C|nr:nucleoside-diphosphate sugar epimerase/dehydratase [Pannonibacter phragmitetus]